MPASEERVRILMYSHDSFGLGHIRRTLAIATHLIQHLPGVTVLVLTGCPLVDRFSLPLRVDYIRLPGLIKVANEEYRALKPGFSFDRLIELRSNLMLAAAQTLEPHLFLVDKAPVGLKGEVLPTLEFLRRQRSGTRTVLGLRDILDDDETIQSEWGKKGILEVLDRFYDEIWVYGSEEIYDAAAHYAIPASLQKKMVYTGYLPRKGEKASTLEKRRSDLGLDGGPLVLVTAGGGGDGYELLSTFLTGLERRTDEPPFHTLLVTGPFMAQDEKKELMRRARKLPRLTFQRFVHNMEVHIQIADLVVTQGGYNTVCEILSFRKPSLIIPRTSPRREQLIRATLLAKRGVVEAMDPALVTPDALMRRVEEVLGRIRQGHASRSFQALPMSGLEVITQRVAALVSG